MHHLWIGKTLSCSTKVYHLNIEMSFLITTTDLLIVCSYGSDEVEDPTCSTSPIISIRYSLGLVLQYEKRPKRQILCFIEDVIGGRMPFRVNGQTPLFGMISAALEEFFKPSDFY